MFRMVFITLLFAIGLISNAHSQNWLWAKGGGGSGPDGNHASCEDLQGNVYSIGAISKPGARFLADSLMVNGWDDFFISKFDADGNVIWTKVFGGPWDSQWPENKYESSFIYLDEANQSLVLYGQFVGSISFGSTTLNAPLSNDVQLFLAKLDLNGNCLWAKSFGSWGDDWISAPHLTPVGSIYITGVVPFNGLFDTVSVPGGGFLAKFGSDGELIFAKRLIGYNPLGANGTQGSIGDILTFENDLFIMGRKTGDSLVIDTFAIYQPGIYPAFLARMDSSGNLKWIKTFGDPFVGSTELSMDALGNAYVGITFFAEYALIEGDTFFANGTADNLYLKFDKNGNFIWVKDCHFSESGYALGSAYDGDNAVYHVGTFSGEADFGAYHVIADTDEDLFVARYDSNGECIGIRHTGNGWGWGITRLADGNLLLTGSFRDSIQFASSTLISKGAEDFFIAKMSPFTGAGAWGKTNENGNLIIYTNPNKGLCNIIVPDEFIGETSLLLSVYDSAGRLVFQNTVSSNPEIPVNLEAEAHGIYHAELSNGTKTYTGKILFE